MLSIMGMKEPWHYRNKAQFPVREDENGIPQTGFFAGRSHRLIPASSCAIQHSVINEVVETVMDFLRAYGIPAYREESHKGLVRHIYVRRGYHTGQIMVCLVINGNELPHAAEFITRLRTIEGMTSICLNLNTKKTNVILGPSTKLLWGSPAIEDKIGGIRYQISPQSFYQVNPVQTEKLYQTALDFADLQGDERVWDLYCGIGTISLFLAKAVPNGQVTGVEIVPEAIENAKKNAALNGISNTSFYCGAAEDVVTDMVAKRRTPSKEDQNVALADVVVVDPPRKGCDAKLLDTIVTMNPEKIVYVSCDPATLARDVKVLGEKGYEVKKVRACDMFPQGGHVETVVLLGRKMVDDRNIEYEYVDYEPKDNEYMRNTKGSATYAEIKAWIKKQYNVSVSSLYIAQVKDSCGFEKRENYNTGAEGHKVPQCPDEKRELIMEAFKHFRMI